jgi:hypothetical protein
VKGRYQIIGSIGKGSIASHENFLEINFDCRARCVHRLVRQANSYDVNRIRYQNPFIPLLAAVHGWHGSGNNRKTRGASFEVNAANA